MDQPVKPDIYIFCSVDLGPGFKEFVLMDNEGVIHGSHVCSDISFAFGDLYMNRPERHKILQEKFPGGYVVWTLPLGCLPPASVMAKIPQRTGQVKFESDG